MKRLLGAITVLAVIFFAGTTKASATTTNLNAGETVNLAWLINNTNSVQIADKLFSDFFFSYSDNNTNNVDLISANVNITALSNSFGFGVSFSQPLIAIGQDFKDIVFKYSATVTDPNFKISDVHLSITGSSNNGGLGSVGEDVFVGGFGATNVGHLDADTTNPPTNLTDIAFLVPPRTQIWVQKDVIVAGGGAANGFAQISIIDQTLSQVPEPSTVMLVGLGLLGLVALRRKHNS